jgi:putative FmdB family regulatory protein
MAETLYTLHQYSIFVKELPGMPIYEYRCKQCGNKFDKLVKLSTKTSEIECPKCGAHKADKSVSLFGTSGNTSSSGAALSASSCGPVG